MRCKSVKIFYNFNFIVLSICILSCGSGNVTDQQENFDSIQDSVHSEKSVFHYDKTLVPNSIFRISNYSTDTTQSYEVLLPSDYDTTKSFPIIIFFDAHARGKLPLKKYKALAEKYHFVFAGSNNSQNGMTSEETQRIAAAILKDVSTRININPTLIFVSGFSGGSKVACTFAFNNSEVRGVIACAAPFNEQLNTIKNHPDIFLLSGNEDFNMLGMVHADLNLSDEGINHQLYVYDGMHEWPEKKYFDFAMQWMQLQAVKSKLMDKKYLPAQLIDYNEWYHTRITDAIILKQEEAEEQELSHQFTIADISYWNDKIAFLKNKKSSGYPSSLRFLAARELNYISMMGYVYTEAALNQNNLSAAKHFLEIYESVDATNPDVWYLKAIYFSKSGNNNSAFASLNKSAQLGYDDIYQLKNEIAFTSLRSMKGYQDLILKNVILNSEKD